MLMAMTQAQNLKPNFSLAFCKSILVYLGAWFGWHWPGQQCELTPLCFNLQHMRRNPSIMNHSGITGQAEVTVGVVRQTNGDVLNHLSHTWCFQLQKALKPRLLRLLPQLRECQSEIPDPSRELPLGLSNSTDLRAEVRRLGWHN